MSKEEEIIKEIHTVVENAFFYAIPDIEDYYKALNQIREITEKYYENIREK